MIQVSGLRFGYHPRRPLLRNISFTVQDGEVLGLLGANGTGKTTLIKCLVGIHRVPPGTVRLDRDDLATLHPKRIAQRIAYVPQAVHVASSLTVLDVVLMGRNPYLSTFATPTQHDVSMAHAALDHLGLDALAMRHFPDLSGGQKQMAIIARALAQESPVIVLDEPTASLDYGNQVRILQLIRRLRQADRTVILTTHHPDHAFWVCSTVALMHDGGIDTIGPPEKVLTEANLLRVYQTSVRVTETRANIMNGAPVPVTVPVL